MIIPTPENLKRKILANDVRKLEGDLADYKKALEIQGTTDMMLEDVEALYERLEYLNGNKVTHLDTLFAEKLEIENELASYEIQID